MVGIPVELARRLRIEAGDEVGVHEHDGRIVIEPRGDVSALFAEWTEPLDDASMEEIVSALRADRESH
jgi:bifunctional DNA-binding transcriptional regulator/antitoxin component of YhaV-PrlF toxin-antitoxin module